MAQVVLVQIDDSRACGLSVLVLCAALISLCALDDVSRLIAEVLGKLLVAALHRLM
jgi:hypothetical protein